MDEITLLVMAAGMGSRYGGLKQIDPVGPNNETIIDYSIYDAIEVGFKKVVFIIREDFEKQFRQKISKKFENKIKVEYCYQRLNNLPDGRKCPGERKKPWGTAHAILSAKKIINDPFVVINGDDFYGRESFSVIYDYFSSENLASPGFCMVAYELKNTLSENGTVTRGICQEKSSFLTSVSETSGLLWADNRVESGSNIFYTGREPVSMNFWGFTPKIFYYLTERFESFLDQKIDDYKSEFLIPTVINDLIQSRIEQIKVLNSPSRWFGVTYKEDKAYVEEKIKSLILNKIYPFQLFEK